MSDRRVRLLSGATRSLGREAQAKPLECKECGQKAYKSVSAAAAKVSATVKEKLQRISSCVCLYDESARVFI